MRRGGSWGRTRARMAKARGRRLQPQQLGELCPVEADCDLFAHHRHQRRPQASEPSIPLKKEEPTSGLEPLTCSLRVRIVEFTEGHLLPQSP